MVYKSCCFRDIGYGKKHYYQVTDNSLSDSNLNGKANKLLYRYFNRLSYIPNLFATEDLNKMLIFCKNLYIRFT